MDENLRQAVLSARTIAVVGLSPNPHRPSHRIATYLKQQGYRIIPVNPNAEEVLGERSYPDLRSVPEKVDIVDIFRRSEFVSDIVDQAIEIGAGLVWMQEGVVDEAAAERARKAGLLVAMDRCLMVDHYEFQRGAA